MDKNKYNDLLRKAETSLQTSHLFKDKENFIIWESYNGQVAALGVSVVMSGLLPTLAIYYQDQQQNNTNHDKAYRYFVLEVIAQMSDGVYNSAETLMRKALAHPDDNELKTFVIDCSIALKQVIRTYKLEK